MSSHAPLLRTAGAIAGWIAVAVGSLPWIAHAQQAVIESLTSAPGAAATMTVRLVTANQAVGGVQLDVILPVSVAMVSSKANGRPQCTANPEINRELSAFAFQPPQCPAGSCTAVRSLIFGQEDLTPIPDGSVLFTCELAVSAAAPSGQYALGTDRVVMSTPDGMRITTATGQGGTLTILPPSPTATSTSTRTATATPTPTATRTPTATGTHTPTRTATQTHTPTPSLTPTTSPTSTPSNTFTPTPTLTRTSTPTATETPTASHTPTSTDTPDPSAVPTATGTFTPTGTATPTETETPSAVPTATFSATPTPEPSATPTAEPCLGDCDGNGEVTIDEIVSLMNIVLETVPASSCPEGDANLDGFVTVDEVVSAVNRALGQC